MRNLLLFCVLSCCLAGFGLLPGLGLPVGLGLAVGLGLPVGLGAASGAAFAEGAGGPGAARSAASHNSSSAPKGMKRVFLGFRLTRIDPGSIYEKVGLREGDLLKSMDDRAIRSAQDLDQLPRLLHKNRRVKLRVVRDGKTVVLKYRLVWRKAKPRHPSSTADHERTTAGNG
jgi:hypothetical protein